MPSQLIPDFKVKAVHPVECLKAGWELIKDQYWLFVGISVVGILIGGAVPFGILMGPMMCGIYLALLQRRRGQVVEFNLLFKGFDYFGDALVATLLHYIPIVVIVVPFYILMYVGMFLTMATSSGEPEPAKLFGFLGTMMVLLIVMMVLVIVISVIFTFTYPLIVDRKLSGIDAVKVSVRAGLANFWGVLGLLLLNGLMGFIGVLFCYVGVFFVMPISFAAIAVAYEQVFGLGDGQPSVLTPPPPPTFT
jgi:hypothetical protein